MIWAILLVFSLGATDYCDKVFDPPRTNNSTCPKVPARNSAGKKCYAAAPIDLNRHADGYGPYITTKIREGVEFANQFSPQPIDVTLLMSLLAKESWFNPVIRNKWNDIGIAQFQLGTAQATIEYMKDLGINDFDTAHEKLPPNCATGSYRSRLTSTCFNSLKTNCQKDEYKESLYCPGFAVKLMAFHFVQIANRDVILDLGDTTLNLRPLLAPDGETEAQIRHMASVYNRGFRIYNSAYQFYLTNGAWPTAQPYGDVWGAKRTIDESKDPYPGGNLDRHYINRCYVWAISGLCGGMRGALIEEYTERLCPIIASKQVQQLTKYDELELNQISSKQLSSKDQRKVASLRRMSTQQMQGYVMAENFEDLKLAKAVARQKYRETSDREWLYTTGLAGYRFYSSGQKDLQDYLKSCESQGCQNKKNAERMLSILKNMSTDKSYREEL